MHLQIAQSSPCVGAKQVKFELDCVEVQPSDRLLELLFDDFRRSLLFWRSVMVTILKLKFRQFSQIRQIVINYSIQSQDWVGNRVSSCRVARCRGRNRPTIRKMLVTLSNTQQKTDRQNTTKRIKNWKQKWFKRKHQKKNLSKYIHSYELIQSINSKFHQTNHGHSLFQVHKLHLQSGYIGKFCVWRNYLPYFCRVRCKAFYIMILQLAGAHSTLYFKSQGLEQLTGID